VLAAVQVVNENDSGITSRGMEQCLSLGLTAELSSKPLAQVRG
jgi:hypothetical protein